MDYPACKPYTKINAVFEMFLKYSHYVHWSGFQIIEKEVTFCKSSHAQFPIQRLLGEVIFPRQHVKNIEENLLGLKNKIFTDISA